MLADEIVKRWFWLLYTHLVIERSEAFLFRFQMKILHTNLMSIKSSRVIEWNAGVDCASATEFVSWAQTVSPSIVRSREEWV